MSKPQDATGGAGTESEEDAAPPQKSKRVFRAWQPLGQWDPTTDLDEFIESELTRIAQEKMAVAGITKLSSFKTHATDLHLWKVKDVYRSPASGLTVTRYKCPLMSRCKCLAMLRVSRSPTLISIDESNMHQANSHNVDQSKFLTWQQRESISAAVQVAPLQTATSLRRQLHRTSPEKAIKPAHARYNIFVCDNTSLTQKHSICAGMCCDWSLPVET